MNKVHVTAASFVTPIGNDWDTIRKNLKNGTSGIRRLTDDEVPPDFPIRWGARIDRTLFGSNCAPQDMYSSLSRYLAKEIKKDLPPGLQVDALISGFRELNLFSVAVNAFEGGTFRLESLNALKKERPIDEFERELKSNGNIDLSNAVHVDIGNACATGNSMLGIAMSRIRLGIWRRAFVLGMEIDTHPLQMMGLFLIGALSPRADELGDVCCPFSEKRSGFVKGEGAAIILLESSEAMEERGAASLGEIVGYGISSDAWNLVEGHPEAQGLQLAIESAIQDAGLLPVDIEYIKAHATSTRQGDRLEIAALRKCFGESLKNIPISSLKSYFGHSTISAGLIELLGTFAMINGDFLAPNLHIGMRDPAFRDSALWLLGEKMEARRVNFALLNSAGYGGQNASIVVRRSGE